MHGIGVRALQGAVLVAVAVNSAAAQNIAPSFERLQEFLKAGEDVYVVDHAGQETWGRVVDISASTLTIARMHRSKTGTVITDDRRTFREDTVTRILRSDALGAKGATLYPASWHRVQALQADTPISVVLDTGERRNYRFTSAGPRRLRLLTSSGRPEHVEKSRISRVLRQGFDDPVDNGLVFGALTGAGAALGFIAVAQARCGSGCNEPSNYTALSLTFTAFGTGVGAFAGWAVDRIHKGTELLFPVAPTATASVSVSPILSVRRRGVSVAIRF